jgi:gamma-glutamyltranspeptidase/glutathione hydrolase
VILNVIDHGMDVAEAVEAPRIHHQWLPDRTRVERWGFSPDTIRLYELMGHETWTYSQQGHAHGILVDPESGLRYGAADSRAFDARSVGY